MSETDPIQRFHANAMQAHGGPYDVTFDFGYRLEQKDEPTYEVRISMSWEHAAAINVLIQRLLEDYERQVPSIGTIREKTVEHIDLAVREQEASS